MGLALHWTGDERLDELEDVVDVVDGEADAGGDVEPRVGSSLTLKNCKSIRFAEEQFLGKRINFWPGINSLYWLGINSYEKNNDS